MIVKCPCGRGTVVGAADEVRKLATGDFQDPPFSPWVHCRACLREFRLVDGEPRFITPGGLS